MRYKRLRKYRKKNKMLIFSIHAFLIGYCYLFFATQVTSSTGAYFNDVEVIQGFIQTKWETAFDRLNHTSSLMFVGSETNNGQSTAGFNCVTGFYSIMINGGEKDMKVPSTYVLYYKERGSAPDQKDRGVEIISGDIPALKSGQSMNLTVMPEKKQKQGTYKFMAYRNPDHKGELWGSEINVSENEISACPQW